MPGTIVSHSGTIRIAGTRLSQASAQTDQLVKTSQGLVARLAATWQGPARIQFQQAHAQLLPDLQRAVVDLKQASDGLIEAAGEYECFEQGIRAVVGDIGAASGGGVDSRIATLEHRRADLEGKLRNPLEHVTPDWPLKGDGDGVPWRTRADDYQDEIAQIDKELDRLQAEKEQASAHGGASPNGTGAGSGSSAASGGYGQMAEQVTGKQDGLFWRKGFADSGYPLSNCTWYAAEAVKIASGGRIDLNSATAPDGSKIDWSPNAGGAGWGNATDWQSNAEAYMKANPDGPVTGIDRTPQVGDVAWFGGHVAFVESVTPSPDGTGWQVVISEENATGSAFKDGEQVDTSDDALRWRRTLDLEPDQTRAQFIHFRY